MSDVIIVGAGIGGLATAIRLAAAGQNVLLLEQNQAIGGKMGEVTDSGYRWDTGPSVITMLPVFEELFATAGRNLADYLDMRRLEPLTRYFYPDGVILDVTDDWPSLAAQISRLAPHDLTGYLRFLAYAADLYRVTAPQFLYGPAPSLAALWRAQPAAWRLMQPWHTMAQVIRHYVHSPHLRQLLGRFATYAGASPFHAPAALNVIAHVELTGGLWYPTGGVYTIATALGKLAKELGVEIRTQTAVRQILVDQGNVTGVELASGERLTAAAVVANVDVHTVYRRLLPAAAIPARVLRQIDTANLSCSGLILLLGVARHFPGLAHHNVFFSRDYRQEFDDIFVRQIAPRDPTIYVAITSKTDFDHAPPGCENWFILINAPPLADGCDWRKESHAVRQTILASLARYGFAIDDAIEVERLLTPATLAEQTGAWRGALYGNSSNHLWTAFQRPPNRSRYVRHLYFVGGTTHPGGGVPLVMLSARHTANQLLADIAQID